MTQPSVSAIPLYANTLLIFPPLVYAFPKLQSHPNSKTWSARNAATRRMALTSLLSMRKTRMHLQGEHEGSRNREHGGSHNREGRHSSDGRNAADTRGRAGRTNGVPRELRRVPVGG